MVFGWVGSAKWRPWYLFFLNLEHTDWAKCNRLRPWKTSTFTGGEPGHTSHRCGGRVSERHQLPHGFCLSANLYTWRFLDEIWIRRQRLIVPPNSPPNMGGKTLPTSPPSATFPRSLLHKVKLQDYLTIFDPSKVWFEGGGRNASSKESPRGCWMIRWFCAFFFGCFFENEHILPCIFTNTQNDGHNLKLEIHVPKAHHSWYP